MSLELRRTLARALHVGLGGIGVAGVVMPRA